VQSAAVARGLHTGKSPATLSASTVFGLLPLQPVSIWRHVITARPPPYSCRPESGFV
jgi:hypothetical protein